MTVALLIVLMLNCIAALLKKDGEFTPFDLKHTLPLRGILAMLVVLGHLDTVVSSQTRILSLIHMATPAVAVFFFMSGYGLMFSYSRKGEAYLHSFFWKSAIKLLIPLLLTTIIYQTILYIIGEFDIQQIWKVFVTGGTPLVHSWYVYSLFFLYLLFLLSFKFAIRPTSSDLNKCLVVTVLVLVYYIVTRYCFGWQFHWWITCMSFPMGLFYSKYEQNVQAMVKRYGWLPIPIVLVLLIIKLSTGQETPFFAELPYVFLGPLVAIALYRLPLPTKNKLLNFLGTISFEIYLTHGIYEHLLRGVFSSPYVYILVVITTTIITSWVLHHLYHMITSRLLTKLS